jgi:GWxTD domain-containing protein
MGLIHHRSWHLTLILAIICFTLTTGPAEAQTEFSGIPDAGVPVFDIDVAAFRTGPDSARLEIYYRITNPRLSYVRRDEDYVASYEITAILTGDNDRQAGAVSNRENYTLPSFDETRRSSGYIINVLTLQAGRGSYGLAVTLDDRISGGTYTVRRSVDLKYVGEQDWVIGGPEFFIPGAAAPADARYMKDTIALVPNVTRSYLDSSERLAIYFEVYQATKRPITQALIEIDQRRDNRHFADTISVDTASPVVPIIFRSRLPGLLTGEARLRIEALDARGNPVGDRVETSFTLDWSLSTMVDSDWDQAVDMLVHIATHDELNALRNTPKEKRAQAFEDFWKSKDPSPETEENEWRDEYYRRIRFANRQYSNPFRPGWRTDFGTVYIRYGEPDEVERHPFELGQKPHEIWYYYSQRREFLFVDTHGNGEYELQYPYDGIIR